MTHKTAVRAARNDDYTATRGLGPRRVWADTREVADIFAPTFPHSSVASHGCPRYQLFRFAHACASDRTYLKNSSHKGEIFEDRPQTEMLETLVIGTTFIVMLRCSGGRHLHWRYDGLLLVACLLACLVGCLLACLTSQQHASASQGRICSDNCTCCHTDIELAEPTFHLTQSQYTDTGPTSPSTDPVTPGAWQGSHWSVIFLRHWYDSTQEKSGARGIRTRDLPLSWWTP